MVQPAVQPPPSTLLHVVGRYALYGEIASGGMATVHYGRLVGPVGFSRTVAIKRLHAQFAKNPEFAVMFLDEARLAARIRHPNVVPTLDVVAAAGELLLVMDYVQGESLAACLRAASQSRLPVPLDIVSAIICATLHGLHAAHEATNEQGEPIHIVHRDVSPQNILVGADGVPRVLDFGVAKAVGRMSVTRDGELKGKLAYMAPEQLRSSIEVDRRTDIYAAGVVLWETLTRQRLFGGENEGIVIRNVLERRVEPPSSVAQGIHPHLDAITLQALDRDPAKRFATARAMALEIEHVVPLASATRVAQWLEQLVGERLTQRAQAVANIESQSTNFRLSPEGVPAAVQRNSATMLLTAQPPPSQALPPAPAPTLSPGGSISQVSSVSVASPTHPPPASRGRVAEVWFAVAGGVILLCVVVLFAFRSGARSAETAAANAPSPSAPAAAPPLSPVPPIETVVAAPPPPDSSVPATPPPPASIASAAPIVHTRSPINHPAGPANGGTPGSKPCTVRSYIDESGIKHFECK